VDVQVYGIIYIFNPPSEKRLTIGLTEDKVAEFRAWAEKEAKALAEQDDALEALNVPSADPPASAEKNPPTDAGKTPATPPQDDPSKDPDEAPPAEAARLPATPPQAAESVRGRTSDQ
jgi:hypothetical protein